MQTDLIVWGAMGVFALFIFFKMKKLFFKRKRREDEPKIHSKQYWKDALNQLIEPEKRKEIIKTVIKNIPQSPPEKEPNYEREEKQSKKTDSFDEITRDDDSIARNMFGTYDYEDERRDNDYQDMWKDILDENTDFANKMFGLDEESKKKKRKDDEDYW